MNIDQLSGLKNVSASELSEVTDFDPIMILVAAGADEAAERIVGYLASKAQLAIEVVTFTYVILEDGREIIARSILIPEKASAQAENVETTVSSLLKVAAQRNVLPLVEELRHVTTTLDWGEQPVHVNGGSFRYWIGPDGKGRLAFGINVGGKKHNSPEGALDVWVWPEICADYSANSIEQIWKDLHQFQTLKESTKKFFTRIVDQQTAHRFLSLLSRWESDRREKGAKIGGETNEEE